MCTTNGFRRERAVDIANFLLRSKTSVLVAGMISNCDKSPAMIHFYFCLLTGILPGQLGNWLASEKQSQGLINIDLLMASRRSETYQHYAKEDSAFGAKGRHLRRLARAEKLLQKQLIRAEDTQNRIQRFVADYPALQALSKKLSYRDKLGNLRPLHILVHTGRLSGDIRVAQTQFQINQLDELSCLLPSGERVENAVLITLDKRQYMSDALPHELGHILALAADPRAYYELLRQRPMHFDCQSQFKHPVAAPAIAMQESN
jgi:hypothetical protein